MKPLVTNPEEVLRKAIVAEDESRAYYLKLADRSESRDVRKKLLEIADRQVAHRVHLEKKYRRETGEEPPPPSLPRVDIPEDVTGLDMGRALKRPRRPPMGGPRSGRSRSSASSPEWRASRRSRRRHPTRTD